MELDSSITSFLEQINRANVVKEGRVTRYRGVRAYPESGMLELFFGEEEDFGEGENCIDSREITLNSFYITSEFQNVVSELMSKGNVTFHAEGFYAVRNESYAVGKDATGYSLDSRLTKSRVSIKRGRVSSNIVLEETLLKEFMIHTSGDPYGIRLESNIGSISFDEIKEAIQKLGAKS